MLSGDLDLLYVAPERFMMPDFQTLLGQSQVALFAIDEAHCVSQWGHDFRPEYLQLSILPERFPEIPRIAVTATADLVTRKEIIEKLKLEKAGQFISSLDRANLYYRVELKENEKAQLLNFLRTEHPHDSGIVYCLSRRRVDVIAEWLAGKGFTALPYHAGMEKELRLKHQQRFLREEGVVIVATIAFGMGIDKPDVRFVAHLDLPKTLDATTRKRVVPAATARKPMPGCCMVWGTSLRSGRCWRLPKETSSSSASSNARWKPCLVSAR